MKFENVADVILNGLRIAAQKPALKFGDLVLSGNETFDTITNIKDFLHNHGVNRGDRILFINDGDAYFPLIFHSIVNLFAIVVPCPVGRNIRVGEDYLLRVMTHVT